MTSTFNIHAIVLGFVLALAALGATAQSESRDTAEREKIMAELRPYRHKFLIKNLSLSKEQSERFLPLYDSMDDELQKINEETRAIERRVNDDADADDAEVEAAAKATFEQKSREAEVEMTYYKEFKEILTPRQLLRLKGAERSFNQWLVRNHRRMSRGRGEADSRR